MKKAFLIVLMAVVVVFTSCKKGNKKEKSKKETTSESSSSGIDMSDKGIGPVKSLVLDATIDKKMAKEGKKIYESKCSSCHKPNKKFIGPPPKGLLEKRSPEWIMNMILNPEQMVKENKIAKQLLIEFNGSPMANQNLTDEEARAVLEYIRTL